MNSPVSRARLICTSPSWPAGIASLTQSWPLTSGGSMGGGKLLSGTATVPAGVKKLSLPSAGLITASSGLTVSSKSRTGLSAALSTSMRKPPLPATASTRRTTVRYPFLSKATSLIPGRLNSWSVSLCVLGKLAVSTAGQVDLGAEAAVDEALRIHTGLVPRHGAGRRHRRPSSAPGRRGRSA